VATVSGPVARWGLESYPGVSTADALADQQPTGGSTPLTANGVTFTDKQRIVGANAATLDGSSDLATSGPVVDTTRSYGVAAWVRLDNTTGSQSIVAQGGAFQLRLHGAGAADRSFCFVVGSPEAPSACGVNTAVVGRWTHVAGAFDAAEKKVRVWVDGVLKQESPAPEVSAASDGVLRIGDRLAGAVADVQVFDRALVSEDFTGDVTDPADAVEAERGILHPVEVARWTFEDAVECYDPTIADTCQEPDGTQFGRQLTFTKGVTIGNGPTGGFGVFDDDFPDDSSITTREYGRSQRNAVDTPVLRTDQSFTVTVAVHVDSVNTTMTAVAPKGAKQSAFYLGTRLSTVDSVAGQRFEIMVPSVDADTGETYTHVIAPEALGADDAGAWHQLTVVYDAGSRTMKLYVNGALKNSAVLATGLWNATGPMIVGNSWYTGDNGAGHFTDSWFGGIDDVQVYQGAMTDAQVAAL